jgi:thymidylate synthase ThyX
MIYNSIYKNRVFHYIQLRSANGTQKEHQEIAIECAKVIAEIFPMTNEIQHV